MLPFGGHTVDIVAPPTRDNHGDPSPGDPGQIEVTGCYMQPVSTSEDLDGRNTVTRMWDLILPPGVTITAQHTVRWRGHLYEVDGDPQPWDDVTGMSHHCEVRLKRVTG